MRDADLKPNRNPNLQTDKLPMMKSVLSATVKADQKAGEKTKA